MREVSADLTHQPELTSHPLLQLGILAEKLESTIDGAIMKHSQPQPSIETQQEAQKIAKAIQKPGQTKEQTKLIAQGIEKGIAVYKKQQKEKKRQADKAQKKIKRAKQADTIIVDSDNSVEDTVIKSRSAVLPWTLLVISWIGFIAYTILA